MGLIDSARLTVKLYGAAVPPAELVRIFHRWIQDDRLPQHLPIDVADYAHVHRGPGIVLACHAGFFGFDEADGRPGLRYRRRRPAYGGAPLPDALRSLATACELLQGEHPPAAELHFGDGELLLQIDDRLRARRPLASLEALHDELTGLQETVFGAGARLRLEPVGGVAEPFAALVRITGGAGLAGWREMAVGNL